MLSVISMLWAGEPRLALNIVAYPNCLGSEVLGEILAGGAAKVKEAGAVLAGGHSINDEEPKYGMSVTGFVHPDKIWKNTGARPGDLLILTKALGSGDPEYCGESRDGLPGGKESGPGKYDLSE